MLAMTATDSDFVQIGLRILHILTAMAAGGAVLFQMFALVPALRATDETQRVQLGTEIAGHWRMTLYLAMVFLLATGLINFIMFQIPYYRAHPDKGVYHGIFGVKFLASLMLFHAAAMLAVPRERGVVRRAKAAVWLKYMTGLLIVIVVCGAALRYFERLFHWPLAQLTEFAGA